VEVPACSDGFVWGGLGRVCSRDTLVLFTVGPSRLDACDRLAGRAGADCRTLC
jgi:hypothetical protein